METTLSTINIFPSNEAEIKHYITTFKNEILSGNEDPLKVLKQLKFVEKTIAALLKDKDLEDHFLQEAEKYGKSFEHLEIKFTVAEVGTRYDFSTCNDSVWNDLNLKEKELTENKKLRETFLKTIPIEGVANADTGELIYPALKTSTTKVTVKL
jgi:hypothetical protein